MSEHLSAEKVDKLIARVRSHGASNVSDEEVRALAGCAEACQMIVSNNGAYGLKFAFNALAELEKAI